MQDFQVIAVDDVSTRLHLGVSAEERALAQEVRISVRLTLADPPHYEGKDRLAETIDYDRIIGFLREGLPAAGETLLIETVADRAAAFCLALSARVSLVEVTVKKPSVLGSSGLVSVGIVRHGRRPPRSALSVAEPGR